MIQGNYQIKISIFSYKVLLPDNCYSTLFYYISGKCKNLDVNKYYHK
jgi:hypothetical protein